MENNKHKNINWSHQWDNVNWSLYTRIRLTRAYPTQSTLGVKINAEQLEKILRNRHHLDSKDL